MKKLLKLISLICVIALLAGCSLVSKVDNTEPKKEEKSATVLTVDGVEYNLERFNLYYYSAQDEVLSAAGYTQTADIPEDFWQQKVDDKTNLQRAKDIALENLINDALTCQKAKELGIEITADEKSQIANQMSALRADAMSKQQFETIGIGEKELEKYYEDYMHISHILPKLIEKGDLTVDDAAAEEEFKNSYVKAKHILITTVDAQTQQPLPEEKVKEAEKKAEQILAKINAGEDFDTLMNENSEDPGLAGAPDGYVFSYGEMVPEFEEAAFALEEDQVSGLVNTSYGIHILKRVPLDMEAEQETAALEGVKSKIVMPDFEELRKVWKSKAKIETEDEVIKKLKPSISKS